MTTPFPAFPQIPSPVTWVSLSQIKAPQLRADVSDAVQLLDGSPFFAGQGQGTQALGTGAGTVIPVSIGNEIADPWNGHHNGTVSPANARWYPQLAGWYLVHVTVPVTLVTGTVAAQYSAAGVQRGTASGTATFSGQILPGPGTNDVASTMTKLVDMTTVGAYGTGDFISPIVQTQSTNNVSTGVTANEAPLVTIQWVCANSGTQPLPVPTNDNWAVPPAIVTSSFMNANVRDSINFLTYPPIMEWTYAAAATTLASAAALPATGTLIGLDTKQVDNYSAFNNSTNIWTAPVSGIYIVYGELALTADANTQAMAVGFTITSPHYNGGATFTWWGDAMLTPVPAGGFTTIAAVSRRRLRLSAGDTVNLAGWQRNSGAAAYTILGSGGNWTTRLGIVWQWS